MYFSKNFVTIIYENKNKPSIVIVKLSYQKVHLLSSIWVTVSIKKKINLLETNQVFFSLIFCNLYFKN